MFNTEKTIPALPPTNKWGLHRFQNEHRKYIKYPYHLSLNLNISTSEDVNTMKAIIPTHFFFFYNFRYRMGSTVNRLVLSEKDSSVLFSMMLKKKISRKLKIIARFDKIAC